MNGPNDPEPSIRLDGGRVVELDGRPERDFDVIDHFVARHAIDPAAVEEAATLGDAELARRLVDVDVPRAELVRLSRGLTRARRAPANQAHVTNLKENPALLAADAAEAALRGFAELETTVGVSRYAPLN